MGEAPVILPLKRMEDGEGDERMEMVTGRSLMDCDPEMVAEGVLRGPCLVLGGQGVMNCEGEGMSVLHMVPPWLLAQEESGLDSRQTG